MIAEVYAGPALSYLNLVLIILKSLFITMCKNFGMGYFLLITYSHLILTHSSRDLLEGND
jgi:hypothetical protein